MKKRKKKEKKKRIWNHKVYKQCRYLSTPSLFVIEVFQSRNSISPLYNDCVRYDGRLGTWDWKYSRLEKFSTFSVMRDWNWSVRRFWHGIFILRNTSFQAQKQFVRFDHIQYHVRSAFYWIMFCHVWSSPNSSGHLKLVLGSTYVMKELIYSVSFHLFSFCSSMTKKKSNFSWKLS